MPKYFPLPPRTVEVEVPVGDGDRDVAVEDSVAFSDALAGTLGPVQTQDSFVATDDPVVGPAVVGDSVAVADAFAPTVDGPNLPDSAAFADALAGTLGPVQTIDSTDFTDRIDIGPVTTYDTVDTDDTISLFTLDTVDDDSFSVADEALVYLLTSAEDDSLDVADMLGTPVVSLPPAVVAVSDAKNEDLDGTSFAQSTVTATLIDNAANSHGDTANAATSTVSDGGGLGAPSQTEAFTLVVGLGGISIDAALEDITSVTVDFDWAHTNNRNATTSTGVACSYDFDFDVSFNDGGSWTTLQTFANADADGITVARNTVTHDVTATVGDDYGSLDEIRLRVTGTNTSGDGLLGVLTSTSTISFHRFRLIFSAQST